MKNAAQFFLILLTAVAFSIANCDAADIRIVPNKYYNFDEFLKQWAAANGVAVPKNDRWDIGGNAGDDSSVARLLINDLPYDANQGCNQLKYAVVGSDRVITITGEIKPEDADAFKRAVSE